MTRAFVFPGQGSQAVGMGVELAKAFPPAREVFEEVDDALNQRLSRLMAEGPESELTLTENAQPALMAVSLAALRTIEREGSTSLAKLATMVAGHSLGEYSALCAAGALGLADTARLLKRRGRAMQTAVPVGAGAMAALMGMELDAAREVAAAASGQTGLVCDVANDNAPGQVVVSGAAAAVDKAIELAAAKGGRRSIKLPVSAPFHCRLMQPAAEEMEKALAEVAIAAPVVPVVANVSATPVDDPDEIRRKLVEQVTATVRWRECVAAMKAGGAATLVECGAGRVLSGLARRIDKDMQAVSVGTPPEVEAFLKTL
ncbi:MAG: ACP S-malonyltransferase [Alphaproteobacteria bacterium]|nr:ACP S-malonyltransferase [Alphaproteobacteria bacterium]